MPDVFTKRKRSEVMSRIRGKGNKDTEIALAKLLRANHVTGWRRQGKVRIGDGKGRESGEGRVRGERRAGSGGGTRRAAVRVDFIFRRERVVVFVDGCFWHGCPIHSSPKKWLKKSSMGEAETTETLRRAQGDNRRGQRTERLSGHKSWPRTFPATDSLPVIYVGTAGGLSVCGSMSWRRIRSGAWGGSGRR